MINIKFWCLILLFAVSFSMSAQTADDCDNREIWEYDKPVETAWTSIKFTDGYTTAGTNGDLHAYIDPLAPCGSIPGNIAAGLNFIKTYSPIKDNEIDQYPDPNNLNYDDWQMNTEYFDGLGRPIQSISVKVSPSGKDMVTYIEYDENGKIKETFLPYFADLENLGFGSYRPNGLSEQQNFYDYYFNEGSNAKSEIYFEKSPLNRVSNQGSAGADWQLSSGNTVDFEYSSNTLSEVKRWKVLNGNLISKNPYPSNSLYKTITNDENGHDIIEYKDKQGRVIMTKTKDNGGSDMETYYIYDDFGLLRYVIPPKASANLYIPSWSNYSNNDVIYELCYYYEYDARKRLVEKKLPGAEPVYMIYDKHDKLVLTQDGNLREDNAWLFTKYDAFKRPVITGLYTDAENTTPVAMQTELDDFYDEDEDPWEVYEKDNDAYTNDAFPNHSGAACIIYSESYYDSYDFSNSLGTHYEYTNYFNTEASENISGLITASKTYILDHEGSVAASYIYTVNWYDKYGRILETIGNNHKGGYDHISNLYNFSGELLKTYQTHNITGNIADNIEILKEFEYDRMSRLLSVTETFGTNDPLVTQENVYDELGQLIEKKLHKTGENTYLQNVAYEYNIKGWLEEINSEYFFTDLKYNEGSNPLYNGNISGIDWSSNKFSDLKSYSFTYDPADRILSAIDNNNFYASSYSYDLNGNIESLTRRGNTNADHLEYEEIDNLEYTYADGNELSNKLYTVDDNTGSYYQTIGFTDNGIFDQKEYYYDANGNLTQDKNKLITSISYNYLNLPEVININTSKSNSLSYIYDAAGIKLRKKTVQGIETTEITDYCGGFVYNENDEIIYILTDYGRITYTESSDIVRHYNITDHLGNTRITFNDQGLVEQDDSYYPFGMSIDDLSFSSIDLEADENKYLFQGQELQNDFDLGLYQFKWRFHDPFIGRFISVDPLAEKYTWNSTYAFSENRVINAIELEGLESVNVNEDIGILNVGNYINDSWKTFVNATESYLGFTSQDIKTASMRIEKYTNPEYAAITWDTDVIVGGGGGYTIALAYIKDDGVFLNIAPKIGIGADYSASVSFEVGYYNEKDNKEPPSSKNIEKFNLYESASYLIFTAGASQDLSRNENTGKLELGQKWQFYSAGLTVGSSNIILGAGSSGIDYTSPAIFYLYRSKNSEEKNEGEKKNN